MHCRGGGRSKNLEAGDRGNVEGIMSPPPIGIGLVDCQKLRGTWTPLPAPLHCMILVSRQMVQEVKKNRKPTMNL
jgi:hypothetical protein